MVTTQFIVENFQSWIDKSKISESFVIIKWISVCILFLTDHEVQSERKSVTNISSYQFWYYVDILILGTVFNILRHLTKYTEMKREIVYKEWFTLHLAGSGPWRDRDTDDKYLHTFIWNNSRYTEPWHGRNTEPKYPRKLFS